MLIYIYSLLMRSTYIYMPVPVAAQSKAWVCGRSPAEISVRIPSVWMSVCCECCVLSGIALRRTITRPKESYRLWCVVVCDLETSWVRRPRPALGCNSHKKKNMYIHTYLLSTVQKFPAWHTNAAPNGKCCEGCIVPSMVRLMYQLKSVLK